jgi:mRNA interferase RelE/StbE
MLGRVSDAIDRLRTEPRPSGTTKLAGRDDYRIRVGDWRVVYELDDARRHVIIVRIAHRRDVYRRL